MFFIYKKNTYFLLKYLFIIFKFNKKSNFYKIIKIENNKYKITKNFLLKLKKLLLIRTIKFFLNT
jgi:hypothetical protein